MQKFTSASLDLEKQQGFESGETGAVEEAGSPRAEYQCPECAKVLLSSRARPLTNPGCMASGGQLWHTQGMENVPAVLAIFIREFGWSTICRIRQ